MKKIAGSVLLLLLAVAFTGCTKDKSLAELMIGKWQGKSVKMISYENGVKVDEYTTFYTSNEETIEMIKGGTGKHYSDGIVDDEFTWTLSGNKLTVTSGTDVMELEITANETTMTYKISETNVDGGITYKTEMIFTGSRI
jgi:hypothetical protein